MYTGTLIDDLLVAVKRVERRAEKSVHPSPSQSPEPQTSQPQSENPDASGNEPQTNVFGNGS